MERDVVFGCCWAKMDAVASRINAIIDSLHFRSFNKVYNEVKRQLPNVTKKEVRKVIMDRKKDRHLRRKQIKPYQIKIFSPTLNCWFMDLIDNGKGNLPRWWHVFIGVNNRYAVVNALNSKDAEDVRQSLLNFILQYHPVKLTSDQEPAFLERQNVQMLRDQKVLLQTVPDSNHSTLGIIDRFIRTLRDMNRPTDNDAKQSSHPSFRHFDQTTMVTLVDTYNNTYHSAINCTPKQMFDDHNLEKEYIYKCTKRNAKQRTIKDFELKAGQYVRYIIARDPLRKKRYQVSHESYKIAGKQGRHYILEARDGSTVIKPRYKLIVADPQKYIQATSLRNQ
jgi:hypothetical protein